MNKILVLTLMLVGAFRQLALSQCISNMGCVVSGCDLSLNDSTLWNSLHWYDPLYLTHDLPEGAVDIGITVAGNCGALRYELFLDTDGNGTQETVINSDAPPVAGFVHINNAANPGYTGGTERRFDFRTTDPALLYRFGLQETSTATERTGSVKWHTAAAPGTYTQPQLPHGNHMVRWYAGAMLVCESSFTVKDCKKPTVVCVSDNFVYNVFSLQGITFWASDFLQYAEDNTTEQQELRFSIRKKGAGNGFPLDSMGNPITKVHYSCQELGSHTVELWVKDKAGNVEYCEHFFYLQSNLNGCNSPQGICITGCNGEGIGEVQIELSTPTPTMPPISQYSQYFTSAGPCYSYTGPVWPITGDITITPTKDTDPLNGVSTFDMLLISKHILGNIPLSTPYKIIAADVNKSGTVTTYDIVETRKLILGIYNSFPANTSWRFVNAAQTFPVLNNPFTAPLQESIVSTASNFHAPKNFIGIKVGDVNCNATNLTTPDDRAPELLSLDDIWLQANETYLLPIHNLTANTWQGGQFSLQFNPAQMTIEEAIPGTLTDFTADNFAQPTPGTFNASWISEESIPVTAHSTLFSLKIKALQPMRLRDALAFHSEQIQPEMYDADLGRHPLQLVFGGKSDPAAAQIFAPQPNPATDMATFAVFLPSKTSVEWEVFDLLGRLLLRRTAEMEDGTHSISVPVRDLPAQGSYVLRVKAGGSVLSTSLLKG